MRREKIWFVLGLAIIVGVFAMVIVRGPSDVADSVIAQSQQHYEEAKKAIEVGNLELAMTHLDAIEKRTPAWYESREMHWKVKEELNQYARTKQ
jgi:outer membrane protein assembly factor BamD (BamD/ComL family)